MKKMFVEVFILLIVGLVLLTACGQQLQVAQPTQPPPTVQPTSPPPATPRPAADIAAEIDVFLNKLAKNGLFSGNVLVARNGEIIFHKAYGLADRDKQRPITNQTRFYLASLTKQFTAAAIMLLEQEGKLKVQDSVCQYLPHCPDDWKPITIHHLLTHTAGLPYAPGLPYSKPVSPAELRAAIERVPLLRESGKLFEYSDVGYILAGLTIEQVSGQPYGEFLQEHIFGPIGMSNTGYGDGGEQLAVGYATTSIKAARFEPTVDHGAGGVYSTAEDLLKWDQALYTDTPLAAANRECMFTPYTVATTFGPDIEYGYGWFITGEQEYQVISHGGTAPGFQTELARHINDHITVIVLANLEASSSADITERILSIIFGTRPGIFRTP